MPAERGETKKDRARRRDALEQATEAWKGHGNVSMAARDHGVARQTLQHHIDKIPAPEYAIPDLPSELPNIDDLLARRKKGFARKDRAEKARKLVPVDVLLDGAIGICHFGDPHVDDDGTDLALLERHMTVCRDTPGLFAANVGDLSNNWVGRLARLYAEQSTSAAEAWLLVEWMVEFVDWLYIVGGNHDLWSGAGDPIKWITSQVGVKYEPWGMRVGLKFPSRDAPVIVNCRHDFAGHSMWNAVHGPMKAIQMGWRDHILTCGHKHTSFGAGPLKCPSTGILSYAIRCAGYKRWDRYAKEKGLPDQQAFASAVTIIDPQYADDDPRLITVIYDPEEGAEYLNWKRGRE